MRWIAIVIAAGLWSGCAAETTQLQSCPQIGRPPPTEEQPSSAYDCANCDDDECANECAALWGWWLLSTQQIAN